MATLLHSESRRLYSWWWDSHNSPKNSKWLQENLTDMDSKVKAMIKLIEEDADSFARRAEMYYKKRPELMKLVEEFYRAYRALAERYNHATGELRQVHRTMAQAFPDQVPFALTDEAASGSESDSPETPHPIRSFFNPDLQGSKRNGGSNDDSNGGNSRKGLKQLNDMFRSATDTTEVVKGSDLDESERASEAETELRTLKESLAKFEAERDGIVSQYREALEKLSNLERELGNAQKESRTLSELACEAKTEIQALHETLKSVEAERDTCLLQYNQSLERVATVEGLLHEAQEDSRELKEHLANAERESNSFKQKLAKLEDEYRNFQLLYIECLVKTSALEKTLVENGECIQNLAERLEQAETEAKTLKEEIRNVNLERDTMAIRYEETLQTVSELQKKLSEALAENGQLNAEVLSGLAELKNAEDQRVALAQINESLQMEAKTLVQEIAAAEGKIAQKQAELEELMHSLEEERSRFVLAEMTLRNLQNTHSQSQEEQRALTLELENVLKLMKDLETCKDDLQAEVQQLKDENDALKDLNSSFSTSEKNFQREIVNLKEVKEKLEAEVRRQVDHSDSLGIQVQDLKTEIEGSYERYRALVQRLESVGLDPECFDSSVKGLQDENSRLKEICVQNGAEKDDLLRRLENMEELLRKNKILESSLSEVNIELQKWEEKFKALQRCCNGLTEDKFSLVAERSALLSQLQIITETMQSLLEKNTSLQTSLCGAKSELEGLRAKSKGLEEVCQLLTSERSNLLAEKSSLVSRLEMVEQKMEKLELRLTDMEDKYFGIEKEKQSTLSKVEELRITLDIEKQERASLVLTSDARLSGLENCIRELREENKCRKSEFEEQIDKAVNAQVEIFILQKFVQEMEDKNYSLVEECQRQAERAQYSEKLITELESENMIQQVEAEFFLGKIDALRAGIKKVLKALGLKNETQPECEADFVPCVIAKIGEIHQSLSESKDEKHQLLMEKSILSTLLKQLHVECMELVARKTALEQESVEFTKQLFAVENEKRQLIDTTKELNLEINERVKREEVLKGELEDLILIEKQLREVTSALQEENCSISGQRNFLELELLHTTGEKNTLEVENTELLSEALALSYQSTILRCYGVQKEFELNKVRNDLKCLEKAHKELEDVAKGLEETLTVKEAENVALIASMEKLKEKQRALSDCNDQLRLEISTDHILMSQKAKDLEDAEQKLKATQDINTELCSTIVSLEKGQENLEVTRKALEKQIVELSEHNGLQTKELVHLREANENLECEVSKLHENIEECKIREVILTSELHERSSEFELWEAEAASFYFDLQISSVREVLYQNKVQDLGSLCEGLEEVTYRRSVEIEEMKQRVASLEDEAESLKSQLTTCLPLIASLKNNVELLEQNPVLQSKLHAITSTEEQESYRCADKSSTCSHNLSELHNLQTRINMIEDILNKEKETAALRENESANIRLDAAFKEIEDLKSQISKNNLEEHRYSSRDSVCDSSVVKSGEEMKDIPLDKASGRSFHGMSQQGSAASDDQMLELWEAAEEDCRDGQLISEVLEHGTDTVEDEIGYAPDQTGYDPIPESHFEKELGVDKLEIQRSNRPSIKKSNKKIALERLSSDSQKLSSLQVSVQELKRKMEPSKGRKRTEDPEYESLRGQLRSFESTLVHLKRMNAEMTKMTEESSMTCVGVAHEEQAQEEAEKITRLEQELQRMQYVLVRLTDEKNSKSKDGVNRSSAAVLLREFFYSRGRKKNKKPKKSRFCGCFKSTSAKV